MVEVLYDGWGKDGVNTFDSMRMLAPEPKRSLASVAARGDYLKCVAMQDFHINAFTVYSPFDVKFKFDRANNKVDIFGDNNVNTAKFNSDGDVEIQLYPQYVFRSTESVLMQLLPPLLTPARSDAFVVPGEFDISKWIRPLNIAFIIPKHIDEFEIKEGEALFSIRFVTQDNEAVKLTRQALSNEEVTLAKACTNITYVKLGLSLKALYELFTRFKASLKPSKCPFHRSKK